MIDTKLLRQKILDLAIRGKLVPQNPTDEPASELLKKIKAEKDALVKAGKIKKNKHESFIFRGDDNRYYEQIDGKTSDITDEIPFDLPNSWDWCRFSTATINRDGERIPLSQKTRENLEKKYDYYGASGVIDKVDKYLFNERLLLIGEDGANLITRSKPIAFIANGLYWVNNHAHVLQAPTAVLLDYLCFFINAIPLDKYVTGSAQPKMTQDKMNTILIPLPPLAEQQRIVEQIETLLGYVDIIDTDVETLEKSVTLAKQKILDLAIRGKLVPQDPSDEPASELLKKIKAEKDALIKAGKIKRDKYESFIFKGDDNCYHENIDGKVTDVTEDIPFDLPDEWEWCRLSTISEFDLGKTLDRQKNTGNYRKYLRSVNVLWGNIDLSDVKEMRFEDTELERYSIKKGDLLICEGGDVGRCAVWNKDFVFYYQNALHRVRFYQKCIPLFYQFVMMFFENTGLLKKISQGVTIKHLTKSTLNSMFFPLPPLAEQKRIVSQVEKLFAVLETMLG